jgi:hypothetical protein
MVPVSLANNISEELNIQTNQDNSKEDQNVLNVHAILNSEEDNSAKLMEHVVTAQTIKSQLPMVEDVLDQTAHKLSLKMDHVEIVKITTISMKELKNADQEFAHLDKRLPDKELVKLAQHTSTLLKTRETAKHVLVTLMRFAIKMELAENAQTIKLLKPPELMLERNASDQLALMLFFKEMVHANNAVSANNLTQLVLLASHQLAMLDL